MSLILYVEDDALLQLDGLAVLHDAGYEVMTASDGREACHCLSFRAGEVHALITDVGLPGTVDGWQVADQARLLRQNLPVIYVTGANAGEYLGRGVNGSRLAPKPYQWRHILDLVVELEAERETMARWARAALPAPTEKTP